jgi:hypothetical protein
MLNNIIWIMKNMNILTFSQKYIIFFIVLFLIIPCTNGQTSKKKDKINLIFLLGDWKGESNCVGNNPNCHDEIVVYHITNPGNKSDSVTLAADKIINGNPELMGILEFRYDSKMKTLVNEFRKNSYHGLWEFNVSYKLKTGTLTLLPDKQIVRIIRVTKVN